MESNIRRAYDIKKDANGEIRLNFISSKFHPNNGAGPVLGALGAPFLGFSSAILAFLVIGNIFNTIYIALPGSVFIGCWVTWKLWKTLLDRANHKDEITILPSGGVKHENIQLSFKDMDAIGTISIVDKSCICATAFGKNVYLSYYVSPTLAASLVQEIRKLSGTSWK